MVLIYATDITRLDVTTLQKRIITYSVPIVIIQILSKIVIFREFSDTLVAVQFVNNVYWSVCTSVWDNLFVGMLSLLDSSCLQLIGNKNVSFFLKTVQKLNKKITVEINFGSLSPNNLILKIFFDKHNIWLASCSLMMSAFHKQVLLHTKLHTNWYHILYHC